MFNTIEIKIMRDGEKLDRTFNPLIYCNIKKIIISATQCSGNHLGFAVIHTGCGIRFCHTKAVYEEINL